MPHHPLPPASGRRTRRVLAVALAVATAVTLAGCSGGSGGSPAPSSSEVVLATTPELRDTGILDTLVSGFRATSTCSVSAAVGSAGRALKAGRDGDANLLLVDAPAAEQKFMAAGHGASRLPVMHSDYVLVGPPDDPADALAAHDAVGALKAIATAQQPFVSRADDSPTDVRERSLWKRAGIEPRVPWYAEARKNAQETLALAGRKLAYSLVDRSGYLSAKGIGLRIITEGGPQLADPFHAIVTKGGGRCAQAFSDYLVKPGTQTIIGTFGVGRFGAPVWFADASQG